MKMADIDNVSGILATQVEDIVCFGEQKFSASFPITKKRNEGQDL